jgi:D-glycero-D-manno-heptose 1,7-bisphosphate phosphatase
VRAFYFDRDGVINSLIGPGFDRGPRILEEFELQDGARVSVELACELGFHCEVISNQPDVARGLMTFEEHTKITRVVKHELPGLVAQRYCLHSNESMCDCRKPKPGMIFESQAEFGIQLNQSYFLGDKWTDVLTAKAANVKSILLRNSKSWSSTSQGGPPDDLSPDYQIDSLAELTDLLLELD